MEIKEVKEGLRKGLGISQLSISTREGSGHSVILGMEKEGGTEDVSLAELPEFDNKQNLGSRK